MMPEVVLLNAFAIVMLLVGGLMLTRTSNDHAEIYTSRPLPVVIVSGAVVGLMAGVLGVGGRFTWNVRWCQIQQTSTR